MSEIGLYRVELEADYSAGVELRAASPADAMQRATALTRPPLEFVESGGSDGQSIRWTLGEVWPVQAERVEGGQAT